MSGRVPITFEPAGVTVLVTPGGTVLEAARKAGILLPAPCGGRGICGACGVRVLEGVLVEPDAEEADGLRRARPGVRLACRARVVSAVTVRPLGVPAPLGAGSAPRGRACRTLVAGVDLGTTSVAAVLVDSASGVEVGRASVPNAQQSYGADVVSRIGGAGSGAADALRDDAEKSVRAALKDAADSAGCDLAGLQRVVIAGNTVMAALLAADDVSSLGHHPFRPPAIRESIPAEVLMRLGLPAETHGIVLQPIAGFVGGDALAATVAAGMVDAREPMLLVDFGTNAEIVLAGAGDSGLTVSSAAAGPAFEGMGITCGGPAAEGAVTRVRVSEEGSIALDVIGDVAPLWFSGSGLVSAVARLRQLGHIDASGLMHEEGPLQARFRRTDEGIVAIALAENGDGCLVLTQLDVRALQLAKSAVRAGIERVLAAGGVSPSDLAHVLVAGAFGSALDPLDLRELGVLPAQVRVPVVCVGNAALDGAAALALDPSLVELASQVARAATHVDLALDPAFNASLLGATELSPL